jgi:hypothetical protein
MTSGSVQKNAAATNEATKRNRGYFRPEIEILEIKKAGIILATRMRNILAAFIFRKAYCQLVSLLSSKALKINCKRYVIRTSSEIIKSLLLVPKEV